MQIETKHIHQLAIRYFEGHITLSEEKVLFQFIGTSSANKSLFRQWEKEWMLFAIQDFTVIHEWKKLQRRVNIQDTLSDIFRKRVYNFRKISAAVAIVAIVLLGGIYSMLNYFNTNVEPLYFSLVTANGEKSKMILSDSTIVWLNAGSTLRYAENFNAGNREVILNGEAYFEVKKKNGNKPFLVKTLNYNILVKGTKFNVTSYPEDSCSITTLLEGNIELEYQGKQLSVKPGESVSFDRREKNFISHYVQASQYKSWVEGRVEYDEITLNDLAVRLSRKYDVHIHLDTALKQDMTFRVSLRNEETINQFLEALSKIIPISFERYNREIYIRKQ